MTGAEQLLDYVPEDRRVVETLGWQPGIWASFFILVGCFILAECRLPPGLFTMEVLGVVFFAGFVLAAWQMNMHRNRTVLVRDNGQIQVFRKRRLDMVVAGEEIRLEKADFVAMIKIGAPLSVAAALFLALGITMLWKDRAIDSGSLSALALGVTSGVSLASGFWTSFFRRHLRVPVKNSRWLADKTVLVSPQQYKLLFPGRGQGAPGPQVRFVAGS